MGARSEREAQLAAALVRRTAKQTGKTQQEVNKSVGLDKPNKITKATITKAIDKLGGT
jgi:hypothetical protein